MKCIGITGGIGSGKSVVSKVFECFGIPVYYSDREAKRLMNSNDTIRHNLTDLISPDLYVSDVLQTHIMAQAIFSNLALKQQVESIIHPMVREDFFAWSCKASAPYVLMESALMFQNDLYTYFDAIIYVQCDKETRIQRVMQRDGLTRSEIETRMNMQPDEQICLQKSLFVIENNNTFVLPQVIEIHTNICKI